MKEEDNDRFRTNPKENRRPGASPEASDISATSKSRTSGRHMTFEEGTVFPKPTGFKRVGTSAAFDEEDGEGDLEREEEDDDDDFLPQSKEGNGHAPEELPLMIEDSSLEVVKELVAQGARRTSSVKFAVETVVATSVASTSTTIENDRHVTVTTTAATAAAVVVGPNDEGQVQVLIPPQPKAILKKTSYMLPPGEPSGSDPPPPNRRSAGRQLSFADELGMELHETHRSANLQYGNTYRDERKGCCLIS